MAGIYRSVRTYHRPEYDRNTVVADETTSERIVDNHPALTRAQLVVQYIVGIIVSLLVIRFLLALFGASQANGFVDFIYDTTAPLVAPFQGLFNIRRSIGAARFEIETLFAGLIYALIGAAIVKFMDIFKR